MRRQLEILFVLLVAVGVQAQLLAQSPLGTIVGTIKDSSGGAVPGANVNVKNNERGYERSTKSDTAGDYSLPDLLPGTYDLTVEAQGFKKYEQTGVVLVTEQTLRVDFNLEVGSTSQSITISGKPPVVNTETASSSEVLPPEKIDRYITPTTMMFSIAYFDNYYSLHSVTASGFTPNTFGQAQPKFTSDGMMVDGYDNMPPAVAVQEVKINDVNAPAEFSSSSTTAVVTKGGDNILHAAAEFRLNHPALNALGTAPSEPRGIQVGNYQVSFSGGGPVVIPHVYDGRNRTFFFGSWDKTKDSTSFTGNAPLNVPTLAMRAGDFTTYTNTSGQVIPIYDPLTGAQIQCNGVLNKICSSRISSVATNYMNGNFLPGVPDFGNTPNSPLMNWIEVPHLPYLIVYTNLEHIRFDQKVTEKDTINFQWSRWDQLYNPFDVVGTSGGPPNRFIATIANADDADTLGWTHVFGPRMVNEFRAGYSRSYQPSTTMVNGQTVLQQLGVQGINPGYTYQGLPTFSFTGLAGLTTPYNQGLQLENRFNYLDNLTMQFGKHAVKVGADLLKGQFGQTGPFGSNPVFGSYSFTGRFTENAAGAGGASWADFLLGYPDTVQRYAPRVGIAARAYNFGVYAQDNWKVSQRLTLDVGLRWEIDGVPVDANGYYFGFDPKTGAIVLPTQKALNGVSPLFNKSIPLELASQAGFPANLLNQDKTDFLPRLGVAFRPFNTNTTVLRAGYGMYHIGLLGMANVFWAKTRLQTGGPFALTESFINTETTSGPTLSMPDPFPGVQGSAASTYAISATNPNLKDGYTQQWNFVVEHELWRTAFSLSYIGSQTINLPWNRNLNAPPPSTTPYVTSSCATPAPRPNPTCRQNYYGFTTITYTDNGGTSSYDGLMFEFRRPMAKGLYLHGGYVWNQQINETDGTDPYDRAYGRSQAAGLPQQRFVVDWLYDLPVGKGKEFLSSPTSSKVGNDVIDGFIGGWSTSAYLAFFSGDAATVTYSGTDPSGEGIFSGGRPDRIASGRVSPQTQTNGFNVSAFMPPASDIGRFGDSGINILRGPHTERFLLSVYKDFPIKERLVFRLDCAFNDPFNQHHFGVPAANISATGVGILATGTAFDGGARSIALDARLRW